MSAEQVLHVLIIKQMQDFSYEELVFHLADSAMFRAFCGLSIADAGPSKSTLHRNIKAISEQTLEEIHRTIVAYAKREGIDDGERVRVDSTVVNAASFVEVSAARALAHAWGSRSFARQAPRRPVRFDELCNIEDAAPSDAATPGNSLDQLVSVERLA